MDYNLTWKTPKNGKAKGITRKDIEIAMAVVRAKALTCDYDKMIAVKMRDEVAQTIAGGINRQQSSVARVNLGQAPELNIKLGYYVSVLYVAMSANVLGKAQCM